MILLHYIDWKEYDGTFLIYALAPEVYLVLISHDINGL